MSINITRPGKEEYAPHYDTYIKLVNSDDIIQTMEDSLSDMIDLLKSIPESRLEYRYEEGKWTIKEILIHLMDAERIFTYRALRFSRNDQTPTAGFDENEYVSESNATARSLQSLIDEYMALRRSTIEFFKNINTEMSRRWGIANGKDISVRALAFIIPGHEMHHSNVIKERYLNLK
jgi:uncharacterized damage-inducible protein DinB